MSSCPTRCGASGHQGACRLALVQAHAGDAATIEWRNSEKDQHLFALSLYLPFPRIFENLLSVLLKFLPSSSSENLRASRIANSFYTRTFVLRIPNLIRPRSMHKNKDAETRQSDDRIGHTVGISF